MTYPRHKRFGPYEILSPLGAGGMGEVYVARDHKLHRDVAIKFLSPHLSGDHEALSRFEREARAVAALSHPNILAIHDFGVEEGVPFAVTELLDGANLRQHLGSPLPPRRALTYAIQVALGLAAAHDRGIIHRDIKPENVFVTTDGHVKVLDFGLAKERSHSPSDGASTGLRPSDTKSGTLLGTVGYMAPEQVRGLNVDHRADIFSFGAVLYEMLGGQRAFARESAVETMNAILKEEPANLAQLSSSTPSSVIAIVNRCLEKEPGERFQSARDLAFALEVAGRGELDVDSAAKPGSIRRARTAGSRERTAWALVTALLAVSIVLSGVLIRTRMSVPPPIRTIRIATGTPGGVYDPIGRGIGDLLGKLPGTQATTLPTEGAFQNVGLIDRREADIALAQNDVVFHSVKTDRVLGHRSTRIVGLALLYDEPAQIVISRAAGIRNIADLRGKPIALGLPRSGSRFSSGILLSYFDLKDTDVSPRFVEVADATKNLVDGTLAAAIEWRAVPTPVFEIAFRSGKVDLLSLDPESLRGIRLANPFLVPIIIPARAYPGLDHDTPSLAVKAMLIARADLPDAVVTDVLTSVFDRTSDLIAYHPRAAELKIDRAFKLDDGMTIDLHPAAQRFYQERTKGVPR